MTSGEPTSTQRLWSAPFIAALLVNLFMASVFYLLMTSMAGYAVEMFSASDSLAGFASSGFILGAVVSRLFTGKFLDFIGRRRLVLISMLGYLIIGLAYIPVTDLWVLIGLRLVHGVVFGAGNTALVASVQSVIPPGRRAEGNGYFATATTLSTAFGPFLAVWLGQNYGFETVFILASVLGGAGLLAGWFFTVPERTPTHQEREQLWSMQLSTLVDRSGLGLGIVIGVSGFAYASVLSFLTVHAEVLGIPEAASGYFAAYAVSSVVARLVVGRVQDRRGANVVVLPVFAFFIVGMLIIGLGTTTAAMIIAGVLVGFGFGSLLPSLLAAVVDLATPARVGVATSTYYLFLDLGSGVGPILLGLVVTGLGFPSMFVICAALALLAALLYLLVHGRAGRLTPSPAG